MQEQDLAEISRQAIQRYSQRYARHGFDPRSIGWDTKQRQLYRFEQTLETGMSWDGKTVLDIGCGFGDYEDFLRKHVPIAGYTGWDLNPDLIQEAEKRHSHAETRFEVRDFLTAPPPPAPVADIGVMLGLINFHFHGTYDNDEYSRTCITKAFHLVRGLLIVDFLSIHRNEQCPVEEILWYQDPVELFSFALSLTPRVMIKHNYNPNPHRECMLFLFKGT